MATAAAVGAASLAGIERWLSLRIDRSTPTAMAVDLRDLFVDRTPVVATITTATGRVPWMTTADNVLHNVSLWRSMHVADWDRIPSPLREQGLDRLVARYRGVIAAPKTWDRMTAEDWDDIPQPVRTMAFREMTAYWAGYYSVGRRHGIDPHVMSDTLAAIVMSESWFDHRGLLVNRDGTMDIGLGGASDYARRRMRELYALRVVDVAPTDADYVNPWVATRFVAVWMSLLLDEAEGDLEIAIRAYNRGIADGANAADAGGARYLEAVLRRRTTFIRNHQAPPAWAYLWQRNRDIEREEWPWIDAGGPSIQWRASRAQQ
jgi:hypothetical protein